NDLAIEAIRAAIGGCAIGQELVVLEATGSTNDLAAQLAADGAPHGTLIVARRQSAGRGRRGRRWWHDADHGIACSLVLRPALPASRAPELVHVAALAVDDTVNGLQIASRIKWPNDIVALEPGPPSDGACAGGWRKLAGILVESSLRGDQIERAVVGIGLNVNTPAGAFAAAAGGQASSLSAVSGATYDRAALIGDICRHLDRWFARWQGGGFTPLRSELVRRSATLGQTVHVTVDGRPAVGRAIDLTADGALLVEIAPGQRVEMREPPADRS
ncbi:MAG: biotin--[acetyl-CoA-carboxylase] ligase, partial [Deltaproteobacteria bacterium]|nr:biotin--[acetyl-CoA-carboxylase] ligase [Deltaproteobacteria bacterium]